jgi:hypothetical protein
MEQILILALGAFPTSIVVSEQVASEPSRALGNSRTEARTRPRLESSMSSEAAQARTALRSTTWKPELFRSFVQLRRERACVSGESRHHRWSKKGDRSNVFGVSRRVPAYRGAEAGTALLSFASDGDRHDSVHPNAINFICRRSAALALSSLRSIRCMEWLGARAEGTKWPKGRAAAPAQAGRR